MSGNTKLVEYGIQNESSDLRIHVCVIVKKICVFPIEIGRLITQRAEVFKLRERPAYTDGIVTARGFLCPWDLMPLLEWIDIPDDIMRKVAFESSPQRETTSSKGRKAVLIVTEMLKLHLIPISQSILEIDDADLQISGTDILVSTKVKIQVKCDWNAGQKELGGTGNLYLQTFECNPYGQH